MVQDLSSEAIETFLNEEIVARIAYVDRRGRPFIVPIAYAYDGKAFYGYSLLGAKIEGMRANPAVCIEIDRVADAADCGQWSRTVSSNRSAATRHWPQYGGSRIGCVLQRAPGPRRSRPPIPTSRARAPSGSPTAFVSPE
jgi:hypothetical protein